VLKNAQVRYMAKLKCQNRIICFSSFQACPHVHCVRFLRILCLFPFTEPLKVPVPTKLVIIAKQPRGTVEKPFLAQIPCLHSSLLIKETLLLSCKTGNNSNRIILLLNYCVTIS
jgi:hypothetical protein